MKKIFLLLFLLFIGCKHACLYDIQKTTPASCTQDGTQSFTCSICGDNFSNILPKTNHSYKTETVTEPTCSVMGVQKTSCQNCNYFYTPIIRELYHLYEEGFINMPPSEYMIIESDKDKIIEMIKEMN